jgi:hypothetical protein
MHERALFYITFTDVRAPVHERTIYYALLASYAMFLHDRLVRQRFPAKVTVCAKSSKHCHS